MEDKDIHNKPTNIDNNNNKVKKLSWSEKEIRLQDVNDIIPNGSSVYIGSCAATADATLQAMDLLENIQIIQMIPGGNLPHLSHNIDRFRTVSFYSFTKGLYYPINDSNVAEGLQDYKPISITAIPRLLQEHILNVDVAIIKVTPPHKNFVSLGMGVECTKDFINNSKIVIAEINNNMPWTEGPSKISIDQIDYWIDRTNDILLTTEQLWPKFFENQNNITKPDDIIIRNQIGQNVIRDIIRNGDTIRFGVSPLVHCVLPYLHQRKHLGLHTDVLTETMYQLIRDGIITNQYKTIDTGRTVVSQAHGSLELYDFIDRNPIIEFHTSNYVCDPQIMAKIDNLVCIIGALKIDLTGQVATDSIAHKFYGGIWSDADSIHGAKYSKNGRPVIIIPSKSLHGRSNIVFALPPGTGVSITRADVEYVVTEYGTANLYGKSIRERCLQLIDIAHPDYREELFQQAKDHHYLSKSQPGRSASSVYPSQYECYYTSTKKDNETKEIIFVRPIKAMDEDNLRDFFHKLSDYSIYLRYFRKLKSMPQRILQKTSDIDYSNDMAIVALYPSSQNNNSNNNNQDNNHNHKQEVIGIAQWVQDPRNTTAPPEIAFQVRDDWQGYGLGKFLFIKLVEIAKSVGIHELKADVLADNRGMNTVFKSSGISYTTRSDFGVFTYTFKLFEESED